MMKNRKLSLVNSKDYLQCVKNTMLIFSWTCFQRSSFYLAIFLIAELTWCQESNPFYFKVRLQYKTIPANVNTLNKLIKHKHIDI